MATDQGYLQYEGPFIAFQDIGLSLFFASQGAGRMTWPVIAAAVRLLIGIGGGAVLLYGYDAPLNMVYLASGIAMVANGVITAGALKMGMWQR